MAFQWLTFGFIWQNGFALNEMLTYYTFKDKNMIKCIRMETIVLKKMSFGKANRRFCVRELRGFTAPMSRRRKTKFATIKPTIYIPKQQFFVHLSPNLSAHEISQETRKRVRKCNYQGGDVAKRMIHQQNQH